MTGTCTTTDLRAVAVNALTCQIGVRISSTSVVLTSETGRSPTRGEDVPFHAPPPVVNVPPAAPAVALLFEDTPGGFGEGGNALDAAFLRERLAARPGQHAFGEGLLAGLGERDERGGAESEFAAPSADDEPLDPASGPGRLDEQVQTIAVRVPAGRGGTDEGGRERLVGMASPARQGSAKTNRLLPALGRISGVSRPNREAVLAVPVPTAMYCLPSTA